jgi:hypothetical protein
MAYADVALDYFDRGYFPLPLPPNEKFPPPDGFTGGPGRYPDLDQISGWVAKNPNGNVALRLSPDLVGIDVDHYRKGQKEKRGLDTLAELETELGPLPRTIMSTSRSNGSGVRLFRVAPGTSLRPIGLDIDTIRSGHRYVVAPPSNHPDNAGAEYQWCLSDSDEVVDEPWDVDELPPLPETWVERFQSSAGVDRLAVATSEAVTEFRSANVDNLDRRRLLGVRSLIDHVREKKGRHDTLVHVATEAAREAAAGAYPFAEVETFLAEWWTEVMAGEPRRLQPRHRSSTTEFEDAISWAVAQANGRPEDVARKRSEFALMPLAIAQPEELRTRD